MAAKRAPFGGMTISFAACPCSMQDVYGTAPIAPSACTKKFWNHVKTAHSGKMVRK